MDVVGGARQTWAVAADDRFEGLIEAAVVGICGGKTLARSCHAIAQPVEIDGEDAAVVDDQTAADHDAGDCGAVLGVDQLVDRVIERQPVRVIEVEHDDVGLVAGREPPDPVAEPEGAGAALGRRQRRLAGRQPPPPVRPLHL